MKPPPAARVRASAWRGLRRAALVLFIMCVATVGRGTAGTDFQGPLRIRNGFPLFQGYVPPPMSGPAPRDDLGLQVAYSSTHLVRASSRWAAQLDLEAAVMELFLRKTLSRRTELSVRLPVIAYNSGVLDGPLAEYHDLFGFPDYGRHLRPPNSFRLELRREGAVVIRADAGDTGLGDIGLSLKFRLRDARPAVALIGFVDLPTGAARKGFGNGRLDGGLAVTTAVAVTRRIRLVVDGGLYLPGDLTARESVETEAFGFGGADLEWIVGRAWSLDAQLRLQGSPFPRTGITAVDDLSVILAVGGRYRVSDGLALEFSFSEDPNTAGAPDFMAALGVTVRFGPRGGDVP